MSFALHSITRQELYRRDLRMIRLHGRPVWVDFRARSCVPIDVAYFLLTTKKSKERGDFILSKVKLFNVADNIEWIAEDSECVVGLMERTVQLDHNRVITTP